MIDEPDGTGAEDACAHARPDMTEVERVEGDAERLQQRHVIVSDAVRDRQEEALWPGHVGAQRAVDGGVAAELDVRAEIRVTGAAGGAVAARVGRLDDHPQALAGSCRDDTAHLVTEHQRRCDPVEADAPVLVPVQVRAAEAHGRDTHEILPGARDGVRFLVDANVLGAVQSKYFHERHDSRHRMPRGGASAHL